MPPGLSSHARGCVLDAETARGSHRAGGEGGNSGNERGLRPANRSEPPSQSSAGKDLSRDQAFLASSMRARNLASCSLMASGSLSPNCL